VRRAAVRISALLSGVAAHASSMPQAYMQEVAGFQAGERDYTQLRGDTGAGRPRLAAAACGADGETVSPSRPQGPLVYPAGFVYVYAWLRRVTGGAVAPAQPLFAALYVATLAVVLCVYIAAAVVPPWALPLLCLSKRLHSIYVLRLFNDPVAMLPAFAAVALAQRGRWCGCAG
jgi:alpha-1,3-mannosyltransferase